MATENFRVVKQQIDEKKNIDYKLLVLKNEMKVMLVHNDNLSKASVALDVPIGNFSNPDNFPGLAHLCQQMIILGSEKYPEYKEFEKIVHNYGGEISLKTLSDHSTYYFHIDTKEDSVLEQVLDRFVQLFYQPLFNDSWIEEQIQIMDSKLKAALKNIWFEYFKKSMVESTHPYSKCGFCKKEILEELTTESIQSRLLDFFKKYYSANIMTLCIISGYTHNKIEQKIANMFCQIQNREIKITKNYADPFKNQLCTKWYIAPKRHIRELRLSFPLPSNQEDDWRQAVNCIRYILESNYKFSLLGILKKENLCSNIFTCGYHEARGLNFFYVLFTLTKDGESHIDDIIKYFFQYVYLFKDKYLSSQDKQWELDDILQNLFKCKIFEEDQTFTEQWIIRIVKCLHGYSIEDLVSSIHTNQHFWESDYTVQMIKEILNNFISPQNIRVYVITDYYESLTEKTSRRWVNAKYMDSEINKEMIDDWTDPPKTNKFLIILKLWPSPDDLLFFDKPKKINNNLGILYHILTTLKSNTIQPYSKIIFYFMSPLAYKHPLNSILNTIFAMLIEDAIKEEKYYPKNIMQWLVKDTKYGIWLEITSYVPVKYYGFLSKIISKILKLSVLREKFNAFKSMHDKRLESFKELHPTKQALFYLSILLSEKSWTIDELSKTSSDVTFEMIQKFIYEFVRNMYVKSFMYGEISIKKAAKIIDCLEIHVEMENDVQKIKQAELLLDREIKLKDDIHTLFEVKNNYHKVSSVLVYLQLGKLTMKQKLNVALICYIMSQELSIYFRKLERSIDGTLVKPRIKKGIQGLIIIVESCINQYIIENYIDQFISDMLNYIEKLSKENFEKFKTELVTQFKKIELVVIDDESTDIFSTEIYSPVRREAEEWHVKDIKQEELIQFYKQNIHGNKAKMSVHVSSEHMLSKQKDVKKEDSSETSKTNTSEESSDEKRKLVRKSKKRKLIDKTVISKKAKMAEHMSSKYKDPEKDMEKNNSSETLSKTPSSGESSGEEKKLIHTSKIHEPLASTSSTSIPIKTSKIKLIGKTLSKVTEKLGNWSFKLTRSNISPEQFIKIVDIALFKINQDFY